MSLFPRDSVERSKVESLEKWWEIKIPPIRFPEGWVVELVPPFAGAVARFVATNTHGVRVSVYYDAHGALGAMDVPYWEVYPVGGESLTIADDDDTARFVDEQTDEMIEYIGTLGDPVRGAIVGLTGGE
jgi:hypothetical protein